MPEQAPYSSIPVAPNLLHYFVPIPLAGAPRWEDFMTGTKRSDALSARVCPTRSDALSEKAKRCAVGWQYRNTMGFPDALRRHPLAWMPIQKKKPNKISHTHKDE